MHDDSLDIPDFLRRRPDDPVERTAYAPRARKPESTWARPKPPRGWPKGMPVPKTVTPEAIALAKQVAKDQEREKQLRREQRAAEREEYGIPKRRRG